MDKFEDESWTVRQLWRMPDGEYMTFESTRMTLAMATSFAENSSTPMLSPDGKEPPVLIRSMVGWASPARAFQPSYTERLAARTKDFKPKSSMFSRLTSFIQKL